MSFIVFTVFAVIAGFAVGAIVVRVFFYFRLRSEKALYESLLASKAFDLEWHLLAKTFYPTQMRELRADSYLGYLEPIDSDFELAISIAMNESATYFFITPSGYASFEDVFISVETIDGRIFMADFSQGQAHFEGSFAVELISSINFKREENWQL